MLNSYWLKNAHIPVSLMVNSDIKSETRENLGLCDIEITDGIITQVVKSNAQNEGLDLKKGIVLPCFVDIHTHLDKSHIWQRQPNIDGTFDQALKSVKNDYINWTIDDLYDRMEFSLKCSYAHGTIAIRTHLDCFGKQGEISLNIWHDLRQKWQNKLELQAVSLVSLDYLQTDQGVKLVDKLVEVGGILGGVVYQNPEIDAQLDTIFQLATERGLDLDFHADENGEIDSICLQKIAKTAIKHQFTGKILCGHCCSLAVQPSQTVQETIKLVKEANMAIVSLPMCNLYLQGREKNVTPFWRGITRVHELKQQGVAVTFASDNCRDPFFAFGDNDMLEVFNQSVRIAHLDTPYENWIDSVTKTPADIMRLPHFGKIEVGIPANLIIFKARYFSELLSRPQGDRQIIRNGIKINPILPDYNELD